MLETTTFKTLTNNKTLKQYPWYVIKPRHIQKQQTAYKSHINHVTTVCQYQLIKFLVYLEIDCVSPTTLLS